MNGLNPAILVPYKNRARYLRVLLEALPRYLRDVNGIKDFTIYVAEQESSDVFNLALSRNVAAKFALQQGVGHDYLVFHDVDMIPLSGIDYGARDYAVTWFMSAGSCKIPLSAFVTANGYNPHFVGWGREDTEFYHRLNSLGYEVRQWHKTDESQEAVILNLELPKLSRSGAEQWSQSYWGHSGAGPCFLNYEDENGNVVERYDKGKDFLIPEFKTRNSHLCERIENLPSQEKLEYISANGLNQVDLSNVRVSRNAEGVVRLTYQTPLVFCPH